VSAVTDRLLDVEEVAEILGVKKSWVREACRDGRLPHVRVGRYLRFRLERIYEWIEEQEQG
jgi:excisionase family DNA binding protein